MKWKPRKKSSGDVIDIRGAEQPSGRSSGGSLSGLSIPGGAIGGIGGTAGVILTLVIVGIQIFGGGSVAGFDVGQVLGSGATPPGAEDPQPLPPDQDPQREFYDFSEYVFDDSQKTWRSSFKSDGEDYDDAKLVVYDSAVSTGGCGNATSAVGPFYCPADSMVYLDLTFYEDMERQLGGGGDFAWAYVIAHEMGHHVQNVLGTNDRVASLEQDDPDSANELSVRIELQADCYAGVWAATVFAEGDLQAGDLDEAFDTAEAIGDDRLQEQAGQSVNPDSFTHGSAEQRREWFEKGYSEADPSACDTFSPDSV
ncbi:MAG: neutral zinc metallopeptidase [Actinomycetota bacterium]|nr:neutral zinc metallopeptidase [Actinomycetota bacterium]